MTVKTHFKYAPGDQIVDLTFDPPSNGVITGKHEKPDAYFVRIQGGRNDVIIHARNLREGVMNRRTGYKQARVTAVIATEHSLGFFKPGYVQAQATHGGDVHNFVDGSLNAAPESLHRIGAKCWLGWMRSASHNLPIIEERD